MAKPTNSTNANAKLLNARVRRSDGSVTFINKVNANGYGTDAKGPQISIKRLTRAGKMLKELDAVPERGTFVISGGLCHTLNKKEQKLLAAGEYKVPTLAEMQLTFIDPATGKPVKADAKPAKVAVEKVTKTKKKTDKAPVADVAADIPETGSSWSDTIAQMGKVNRKSELIAMLDSTIKAATAEQLRIMSRQFKLTVPQVKEGGASIVSAIGRTKAEAALRKIRDQVYNDAAIKHMPATVKKLLRDGELILNQSQTTAILEVLGCDVAFYATSLTKQLPRLRLTVGESSPEEKEPQKKKQAEPTFAHTKEVNKRIKKLTTTLVLPKKGQEHKQSTIAAKKHLAAQLNLDVADLKQGLLLTNSKGQDLMLVGFDAYSIVLAPADGGQVLYAYSKARSAIKADGLRLAGVSELDAKA